MFLFKAVLQTMQSVSQLDSNFFYDEVLSAPFELTKIIMIFLLFYFYTVLQTPS